MWECSALCEGVCGRRSSLFLRACLRARDTIACARVRPLLLRAAELCNVLLLEQSVWVMFYFGLGDATNGHAVILVAFSTDLVHWEKDPAPLYNAGGHPLGIDAQHAHKVRTGQRRPCCPKACNGLHPAYHAQQHPTIQRLAPTPRRAPHGIRHPASNIQHNIHHATSRRHSLASMLR